MAGGACTHALQAAFEGKDATYTYRNLMVDMGKILSEGKYTQVPSLSSSKPFNLDAPVAVRPETATRARSLLIGINYKGQGRGELKGCHNDVAKVQEWIGKRGFSADPESQRVLMDDGVATSPTKANIWSALQWLVEGAQPGDALFVHFSGHGGQVQDEEGLEFDQSLIPIDHKTAGSILDEDILSRVIKPLPKGVDMFCVMDCCHSGSIMDLPYTVTVDSSTGAALSAGQMQNLGRNQVFLNKGMRRAVPGMPGGLARKAGDTLKSLGEKAAKLEGTKLGGLAMIGGCALCMVDACDLLGDSDSPGGSDAPGAKTGCMMCCAGVCSCCMDVTDFLGDSQQGDANPGAV